MKTIPQQLYFEFNEHTIALENLKEKIKTLITNDKNFIKLAREILYYKNCKYEVLSYEPFARLEETHSMDSINEATLYFDKNSISVYLSPIKSYMWTSKPISVTLQNVTPEYLQLLKDKLKYKEKMVIAKGREMKKKNDDIMEKNKKELIKKIKVAVGNINTILASSGKSQRYSLSYDTENIHLVSVNGTKEKMRMYNISTSKNLDRVGLREAEDENPFVGIGKKTYEKFNTLFRKEDVKVLR